MSINTKWKKSNGKLPEDAVTLPAFNPTEKKGKQILYLADENPASDIYPLPEYGSGNTAIETDIECNFFQLNNIKTGFAAGTMVTFFNGTATNPEEQIEIEHAFKKKTSGTDNAGEILLNFQNPNTTAPEIKPLRSNELDKQYEQLSKDTINKILYSHRVSNGLLFGIKTPGELGGNRSEFDLAWEHFSNTYVKPKQQEEEEDMNYLLQYFGFYGNPVKIIPLDPIGIEITVEDVMSVLTFEEKRKLIFDKLGMVDETKKQIQSAFSSSKDFILEKFKSIGESADNYEIVEECFVYSKADKFAESKEDKVMKYLSENQKATISKIAEALGMSKADVYKTIETLGTQNKLIVKYTEVSGEIQARVQDIQSTEEVNTVNLETKWRYTTNLSPKLLDTSREFCIDMINQNKLYTRAEIDLLQNEASTAGFNDDVFMYKGGWMTIKGTNTHVPQCRHFWQSVIVKKK
jgi:predicted transcriptional regulator